MSLQVAPHELCLPMPARPEPDSQSACLSAAIDWIDENIPHKRSPIYRPELAWIKGGNCFAQALGCLAELDNWDIPSGIVLDEVHAEVVASTDEGVFFLDPIYGEIRKPNNEESKRGGYGLSKLYDTHITRRLDSEDCSVYFFRDHPDTGDDEWHSVPTSAIRGQTDLTPHENAHIIVDGRQGKDMLLAIGDLKRYQKTKPHIYREEYYDLIQYVPDFIELSPPDQKSD